MKKLDQRRLEKLKELIDNQSDWMMVATSGNECARIELVQKSRFYEFYAIVITRERCLEYHVEDGCISNAKYYKWFRDKFEKAFGDCFRMTSNQLKN